MCMETTHRLAFFIAWVYNNCIHYIIIYDGREV